MRLVVISDTHGRHRDLGTLEGDVLVHCGDFGNGLVRDPDGLRDLDAWFAEQRVDVVLCVGGNHDFDAEERARAGEPVFEHAVWMLDGGYTHAGLRFWGSPWCPDQPTWAFHRDADALGEAWARIPDDTDVLVTHTPPHGILDLPRSRRAHVGCPHLRARVDEVGPRYHLFGHVHASHGVHHGSRTTFVNAAVVDGTWHATRPVTRIDVEPSR